MEKINVISFKRDNNIDNSSKNNQPKDKNIVILICLINIISQLGTYFCTLILEEYGFLIGVIGFFLSLSTSLIFYYGYNKKFTNYQYTNIFYIILQSSMIGLSIIRICQYICYATIHKIYNLTIDDPLNGIKNEYFSKGMKKSNVVLLHCLGGILFIVIWIMGVCKALLLYLDTCKIQKEKSNIKKLNKMKTEPIQVGSQKADWNSKCIY